VGRDWIDEETDKTILRVFEPLPQPP
jgi:hypothetical protein